MMTQSSFEKKIQEHDKKPILEYSKNQYQSSMPFPMLKWNNRLYKITINKVSKSNVGDFSGEIYYHPISAKTPNNSSTALPKGTTVYLIKGVDPNVAIAYKTYTDIYKKAFALKNQ